MGLLLRLNSSWKNGKIKRLKYYSFSFVHFFFTIIYSNNIMIPYELFKKLFKFISQYHKPKREK